MLPPEIQVQGVPGDVRYDLPVRQLGGLRWIGLAPLIFSAFFISVPIQFIREALRSSHNGVGVFNLFFLVFGCAFIIAGLIPAGIGLMILCGRTRIIWRDGRLRIWEMAGPLGVPRRMPKSPVVKLDLSISSAKVNGQPVITGPLANIGALVAEFESGEKKIVAIGYPREWLLALAQDLSARIGSVARSGQIVPVEVIDNTDEEAEAQRVIPQPANSKIKCERMANGLTLTVPPAGLWRGTQGMFFFALFWCGFMTVFSSIIFFQPKHVEWVFYVFIAAFWAIGISLMLGAINMGRRHARMAANGSKLEIEQHGIFGVKNWSWQRSEINEIVSGPSGTEVNHRPVIELQIHPKLGKKIGFFSGRKDDELDWLAYELSRALQLTPQSDDDEESAPPVRPQSK